MVAEAKTMLAKAKSDLNRYRPLAAQNAVSQSDLDAAEAIYEASVSGVEAAEANLRASKIQLSYTTIYSPIAGIIGQTKAKVGDFVGKDPNPVILNVVSRIDTALVEFFITETQYLQIARFLTAMKSEERARRNESNLRLILVDGSVYGHKGRIDFIDREIDPTTGSMLVQASFPNPDELLRPGQFAKVKARVNVVENAIQIPQRCVMELQGTYSVYVVDAENKVELRTIDAGPKINNFWLILSGLQAGEKIVYEGLQKVRAGATIDPVVTDVQPIISENN
jgi:membrane fusion protein (multidrug efflux system)